MIYEGFAGGEWLTELPAEIVYKRLGILALVCLGLAKFAGFRQSGDYARLWLVGDPRLQSLLDQTTFRLGRLFAAPDVWINDERTMITFIMCHPNSRVRYVLGISSGPEPLYDRPQYAIVSFAEHINGFEQGRQQRYIVNLTHAVTSPDLAARATAPTASRLEATIPPILFEPFISELAPHPSLSRATRPSLRVAAALVAIAVLLAVVVGRVLRARMRAPLLR